MECFDLLIVGGGINGTAIAREAAGRGVKVLLVERDDLAQHTSSASSKLIHGGLRYLERYEFRLVRESLRERSVLLKAAPHIVRPLRFVLPQAPGVRSAWMVRAGLALYDALALRGSLPRADRVRSSEQSLLEALRGEAPAHSYWDAWVDDARLVVLNALDAAEHGATIATRTELMWATRAGNEWQAELSNGLRVKATTLVNAAGPWVTDLLDQRLDQKRHSGLRLVRGSHVVVPSLFDGDHAFILQQPDRRIVFAIAYEGRFTLIGTTDAPVEHPGDATPSSAEVEYLCTSVNSYFRRSITPADVVHSFAGIRALYDDGKESAREVTRDYRLELDEAGPSLLSVFGGKITTARALAEEVAKRLKLPGQPWTRDASFPGGDLDASFERYSHGLKRWMPEAMRRRLVGAYGSRLPRLIGDATSLEQLGRRFGDTLSEGELIYLRDVEWARTGEDVLWRRTKLGLHLPSSEQDAVGRWMAQR
jgi:glycerol-3-phosphate dehydrogenase